MTRIEFAYVRLEISPHDRDWIRNLQPRRSDEELGEEREGAPALNTSEAEVFYHEDPRAGRVPYQFGEWREVSRTRWSVAAMESIDGACAYRSIDNL